MLSTETKAASATTAIDGQWSVTLNAHDYKDPNMDQMAAALMSSLHPITKLRLILGDVTLPMRRAIETAGLQRRFPL
jgi:hypothetical protein